MVKEPWCNSIGEMVKEELDHLHEVASEIAEEFYQVLDEANHEARDQKTRGSYLTVRVRRNSSSVYIEWQSYFFYKKEGGRWGRGFEAIPKARDSHRYPGKSLQKHCNDQRVMAAAEEAEQKFAAIREYAAKVVKLRTQAAVVDRARDKYGPLLQAQGDDPVSLLTAEDEEPS